MDKDVMNFVSECEDLQDETQVATKRLIHQLNLISDDDSIPIN